MENRFKIYFEKSADAFILIKDNKIIDCNYAAIKLFEYADKSELINKHPADISPLYQPDNMLSVEKAEKMISITKKNGNHKFEWVHLKKDKTEIQIEVCLTLIAIDGEEILHGVWHDISHRKEKEIELRRNNELNKKLFATIPDLVVIVNVDGTIIYVNEGAKIIGNYEKDELIGKNMIELIVPEDINKALENTVKMMSRPLGPVEYHFISKEKNIVLLEVNGEVLRNENNSPYGMVYICRDVTERKKAQQELIESENRFKVLQEAAFASIVIHHNGIILEVSQSFCDLSGYKYDELIGVYLPSLFIAEAKKIVEDSITCNSLVPYTARLSRKTGFEMDVEILGRQMPYKGKIVRVAEIRNISERIITENKLKEYAAKLEEANNTKDKLFSIIAHDLRSPFQGLLGYGQLLETNFFDLEKTEIMDIVGSINSSLKSLYYLIENLLQWSRLQAEGFSFNPVKINVSEKCDFIIKTFLLNIQNKQLNVINNIDTKIEIMADENMINSVIHNLLSNAIKFSKPNCKIYLESEKDNNFINISIVDSGIGINEENLKKLFKIEQGFSLPGTANEKGTGLGLLLCKEMIELHGGSIKVKSKENIGSEFTFSIPQNFN
ncbi:MAG: PAS domain-containing sensor histidine kinase [bacterium]